MLRRSTLLEAINDAVEKAVDKYNSENDCEVMLTVERGITRAAEVEDIECDALTIDGGDVHGVYAIYLQDE